MVRLSRMVDARSACHTNTCRNTSAVAAARPASVNSCQGWKSADPAGSALRSVEVSELIVEAIVEVGIDRDVAWCRRSQTVLTGRAHGEGAHRDQSSDPEDVRQQPRQTVEPLVERRAENLLAAVLRDERLDDLVVRLVLVDERGQLRTHLVGRGARVLPAF